MMLASCDEHTDTTKQEIDEPQFPKTNEEIILGTWHLNSNKDERISLTFFDNGTYAHYETYAHDDRWSSYEGFYRVTSDSVIFTIVQAADIRYNRSVKITKLSDETFSFQGFDNQRFSSGIIYDGIYVGSKEISTTPQNTIKYRKDIIGKWNVTINKFYGTIVCTIEILDNGKFIYYDDYGPYQGTYGICDDKVLFLEDTQKCPIGGLYTIKELSEKSFVLFDDYDGDQIEGLK